MAMTKQAPLMSALSAVTAGVSVGSSAYAVDEIEPEVVVRPQTYEEAAAVVHYANDCRLAVIPLGARTHADLGNVPAWYDIALDLSRLNAIVEFEPADLTIACQAGVTLGALRSTTSDAGMMVAFDPAIPDEATVGGVLAANVWGAARIQLGAPRDFTIGLRVVTADGRLTRAGGKVVKNVAGYDLCKLYISSLGTLGVIVEATLKALPVPPAEASLSFAVSDCTTACRVAGDAYRAGLAMRSAAIAPQDSGWRLDVALAGSNAGVERSREELQALVGSPPTDTPAASESESPLVARLTVLPSRLPSLVVRLGAFAGRVQAYPLLGTCRFAFDDQAAVPALQAIARESSGACILERCPAVVKAQLDVFGEAPPGLTLMRAIKNEFDPNGVLSPGRMAGKI